MSYVEYPVSSSSGWLDAEDADKGFTGPLFFSAGTAFTGAAAQAPGNRTWRRYVEGAPDSVMMMAGGYCRST